MYLMRDTLGSKIRPNVSLHRKITKRSGQSTASFLFLHKADHCDQYYAYQYDVQGYRVY